MANRRSYSPYKETATLEGQCQFDFRIRSYLFYFLTPFSETQSTAPVAASWLKVYARQLKAMLYRNYLMKIRNVKNLFIVRHFSRILTFSINLNEIKK